MKKYEARVEMVAKDVTSEIIAEFEKNGYMTKTVVWDRDKRYAPTITGYIFIKSCATQEVARASQNDMNEFLKRNGVLDKYFYTSENEPYFIIIERMKKYYTADREAGNLIEAFNTYEEAKQAILAYEEQDKADGTYEENFYAVVDEDRCIVCE